MRLLITLSLLAVLFTSCYDNTSFFYYMEGELTKSNQISVANRNSTLDFTLSLSDSEELAVYAFQLQDLKTNSLILQVNSNRQINFINPKIIIDNKEVLLLKTNSNELKIENKSILKTISENILNKEKVTITFAYDVNSISENTSINLTLILKIKGTFVGEL